MDQPEKTKTRTKKPPETEKQKAAREFVEHLDEKLAAERLRTRKFQPPHDRMLRPTNR